MFVQAKQGVPAWVKSPGRDGLLTQAADLWNERLRKLQQTTASPELIAKVTARANRELRELCRVYCDEGRRDAPGFKKRVRQQMAWSATFDEAGRKVAKGTGDAWLSWYPKLIDRLVRECELRVAAKRQPTHRTNSWRSLRASLDVELSGEWERYRKLATRSVKRALVPPRLKQRMRGPNVQGRAFEKWEMAKPLHAAVLAAVITPTLAKIAKSLLDIPEGFSAKALLEEALSSFQNSVPKASSSLSVHKRFVVSRARSRPRKVAQGFSSNSRSKEFECTSRRAVRLTKAG